jgi:hypothetical protein
MRHAAVLLVGLLAGCEAKSRLELDISLPREMRDYTRLHIESESSHDDVCQPLRPEHDEPPRRIESTAAGFSVAFDGRRPGDRRCFHIWYDVDGDGAPGPGDPVWQPARPVRSHCTTWFSPSITHVPVALTPP